MNNELTSMLESTEDTMSSKQITELLNAGKSKGETKTRHDNVKISMERLRDRGVIKLTALQEVNHLGQTVDVLLVNERDSYIVVAQLCPEFTASLVDHWRELRGENIDLKVQIAVMGKQIDKLSEMFLNKLPATEFTSDVSPATIETPMRKRKSGYTRNRMTPAGLRAWLVEERDYLIENAQKGEPPPKRDNDE